MELKAKPYPKNAKKHSDAQLKLIAASLKEFGWQQPIVVDKNNEIIVGHGRYFAYQKYPEGIEKPWIQKADKLTPAQVKAYRLADNKLNESDWDMALAVEELKELETVGVDITLLGFDTEYLQMNTGTPTEADWATAFDKETLPKELEGLRQVTFILGTGDVETLKKTLSAVDTDKNKALMIVINEYNDSQTNT